MTSAPRLALALALAALALAGCGAAQNTRATQVLALTGNAGAGSVVYIATCESCHASDGSGTPSSDNVSLKARVKTRDPEAFVGFIIDGVPGTGMVGFPTLTDQQLADVYAYIKGVLGT